MKISKINETAKNHVMLFAYDFPHKKTQDFIFRLLTEGYKIDYIIAAPLQKLNIPPSTVRIAPHNVGLIHPRIIAKQFGIQYKVYKHNSVETVRFIKKHPVQFYIISGARILKENVIEAAENKIINIHPGLLPQMRGLDTLLWSIYKNVPIGMTAHFISPKIDSGLFIYKEPLIIYPDDTIIDIGLRLLEKQTDILMKTLDLLKHKNLKLVNLDFSNASYYSKMPAELEKDTIKKFEKWKQKFSEKSV